MTFISTIATDESEANIFSTELEGKSERVVKLFWNIRDLPY
jgi:hypothetical protein